MWTFLSELNNPSFCVMFLCLIWIKHGFYYGDFKKYLAPRIKELRNRQDELSKTRLQIEAEDIIQGIKYVDTEVVKLYANSLKELLAKSDIVESKAIFRAFIQRIDINKDTEVIEYRLPLPNEEVIQTISVLPMVTSDGVGVTIVRTFSIPLGSYGYSMYFVIKALKSL